MNRSVELSVFLVIVTLFSVVWGKSVDGLAKSKTVSKISLRLMNYFRVPLDKIKFFVIWFSYIAISLSGTMICCFVYKINLTNYLISNSIFDVILYTIIGFIFQFEVSSVLLLIFSILKSDTNWYRIVSEITWVKVSFNLPRKVRILYPTSAALFEELFFRCSVFLVLITKFDWVPLPISTLIVTMLFVIEQVVCTQKLKQAIAMSAGSLAISLAGCLMIVITGSILPAIICHEMYVIFYLKK
ncbi:CPBP family glutamic-type intramembrane protease [Enterococcus faecalis]|uniref:CPBP family glutamic-type intramembrane protease n=1 Tax=Enterococcus faecalis TaxID=1351 RepID=UPI002DB60A90|nr:CPBP family glutamic-type intramembrane protease [Enterococcus faecalis]MEB7954577.1 hypothetical protein [Enterococcus faecalis]MEB7964708.1 hypothetical protein [Enterococcus faecalis]